MGSIRVVMGTLVIAAAMLVAPAVQAKAGPTSSLTKPGSCATLLYSWTGFRKAAAAEFRLHHNGVYQDEATVAGVGSSGSLTIPAALAQQMLAGEHYTVMALLEDASQRVIQPSPAVWYGYC